MATWDELLDMDPEGMSDLGLVSDTAGSNVGDPGEALGGRTNLEQLLLSLGDPQAELERLVTQTPTFGEATREVLGNPIGALSSAALVSILGLTQGGAGVAAGLEGIEGAITQRLEDETARHENAMKAAESAIMNRYKLASGMQQLLMQRPEVVAGEDPRVIGEMAFPGAGLYVNPAAALQGKQTTAQVKTNLDVLKSLLPQATGAAKNAIAMSMINMVPGLRAQMPPDLFEMFARQDGDFTDQQLLEKFGATGIQAALDRQKTGRLPYEILKPIAEKDQTSGKRTEIEVKMSLLEPVRAFINEQNAQGKAVDLDQAVDLALDATDAAILRDLMPDLRRNEAAFLRTYMQTVGQAQMFAMMNNDLMTADPAKFKANMDAAVMSVMDASQRLERQNLDIDFALRVEQVVNNIQRSRAGLNMSLPEQTAMARKVVEQEFRASGRAKDIPAPGRDPDLPTSNAQNARDRLEELRKQQREREQNKR